MIQVYQKGNKNYDTNGDMTLMPTKASVHAILNGTWEAEIIHPIDAYGRWKYIEDEAVIKMQSFNGEQLFRIKKKEKSDSGITATMEPIFMDAKDDCFLIDARPTLKNGQEALNIMTAPNNKYSGKSDITSVSTAYYEYKNLIEAINGEDDNSFINRWGGEILFDNFTIIINERVGGDYGVDLRYGKNIEADGLTEEIDVRDVVTRIYPKAYNGHTMTNSGYVDSPLVNNYPTIKIATMTFEDVKMTEDVQEDEEQEDGVIVCNNQSELDAALTKRCKEQFDTGLDKPSLVIEADMLLLQETDLYKDYAILETVSLGDTIHCRHSKLNIETDARVIELEYDGILEKVTSVMLGDFQVGYFDNVSSQINRIDEAIRPDGSLVAEKIKGFINGAMTSLRAQYNVAEKQDVLAILFENLDESSDLYGALAIGTQGLMISKTRTADKRDWDWTTAITAAGMIADTIVAGLLSDQTGKNYWNLNTGELVAGNARFKNFSGSDSVEIYEAAMKIVNNKKYVGKIGSNNLSGNENIVGLVFELEDGDYMFWGIRSGDNYKPIMIYTKGGYTGATANALNFACDLNIGNNRLLNIVAENGKSGWDGTIPIVTNIEKTESGIKWTESKITVSGGIVTSGPAE